MAKTKRVRVKPKGKSKPTRRAAKRTAKAAAKRASHPVFHVDAFTSRIFHGNPAAVVLLDGKWLSDDLMQSIAAENHLPMTAFVLRGKGKKVGLRWFNAVREFELCGHATLAAAHVLWNHAGLKGKSLTFTTRGGDLSATRDGDLITLDFPAMPARKSRVTNDLCAALGREPTEVYEAVSLMAVFENKRDIHSMVPDMAKLARLSFPSVIVTAPGAGHDFVSRYFAPRHGLDEDHATGSSHCTLVPYWADRLGKAHLTAHQVSHRGGELWCELREDRVLLGGHAATFGHGTIGL